MPPAHDMIICGL